MESRLVRRILNNHKIIPFVDDILNKVDRNLMLSQEGRVWIVYADELEVALKRKDYIEFENEEEAKDFVASYRKAFDEIPIEEMDQKEYETMRGSVKWKYEGTIERVG